MMEESGLIKSPQALLLSRIDSLKTPRAVPFDDHWELTLRVRGIFHPQTYSTDKGEPRHFKSLNGVWSTCMRLGFDSMTVGET